MDFIWRRPPPSSLSPGSAAQSDTSIHPIRYTDTWYFIRKGMDVPGGKFKF